MADNSSYNSTSSYSANSGEEQSIPPATGTAASATASPAQAPAPQPEVTVKKRGTYTSHSCDVCRSKHAKCDGGKPKCGFCAANDIECSYAAPCRKRGRKRKRDSVENTSYFSVFETTPVAAAATKPPPVPPPKVPKKNSDGSVLTTVTKVVDVPSPRQVHQIPAHSTAHAAAPHMPSNAVSPYVSSSLTTSRTTTTTLTTTMTLAGASANAAKEDPREVGVLAQQQESSLRHFMSQIPLAEVNAALRFFDDSISLVPELHSLRLSNLGHDWFGQAYVNNIGSFMRLPNAQQLARLPDYWSVVQNYASRASLPALGRVQTQVVLNMLEYSSMITMGAMACCISDVAAAFAHVSRNLISELIEKRQVHTRGEMSPTVADALFGSVLAQSYYNCCFGKMDRWKQLSYLFMEIVRFQPNVSRPLHQSSLAVLLGLSSDDDEQSIWRTRCFAMNENVRRKFSVHRPTLHKLTRFSQDPSALWHTLTFLLIATMFPPKFSPQADFFTNFVSSPNRLRDLMVYTDMIENYLSMVDPALLSTSAVLIGLQGLFYTTKACIAKTHTNAGDPVAYAHQAVVYLSTQLNGRPVFLNMGALYICGILLASEQDSLANVCCTELQRFRTPKPAHYLEVIQQALTVQPSAFGQEITFSPLGKFK